MKRNLTFFLLATFLVLPATAQEHDNSAYLSAVTSDFNSTSEKLYSLAEAIPEDHFDWSPADGIRSVVEVINHVSDANFGIAAMLGHESDYESEAMDTKEGALARLAASQDHIRELMATFADADLTTTAEVFGTTMNHYGVVTVIAGHTSEHLGQLIAYARSNGVSPPWSGG